MHNDDEFEHIFFNGEEVEVSVNAIVEHHGERWASVGLEPDYCLVTRVDGCDSYNTQPFRALDLATQRVIVTLLGEEEDRRIAVEDLALCDEDDRAEIIIQVDGTETACRVVGRFELDGERFVSLAPETIENVDGRLRQVFRVTTDTEGNEVLTADYDEALHDRIAAEAAKLEEEPDDVVSYRALTHEVWN